jgi:hypothetical protein
MNDDELWQKISGSLLKSPTEAKDPEEFVAAVMARLPEERPKTAGSWWRIPIFALAAILILTAAPRLTDRATPSDPLVMENSSEQAQELLHQPRVDSEDFFNLLTEDSRL